MKARINKNLNILIMLLCCMIFSSGCEKAPMNGNADRQWQLMHFETADGTIHPCERIYYAIQLQLVEIRDKSENKHGTFVGRFNYDQEAEKITVKEFSAPYNTNTLATREQLLPFGMDSTETVFDVIKADGKSLILRSDYATLTFRSF